MPPVFHRTPDVVALLPLLCMPAASSDADTGKLARGKAILQQKCGRCHAISPLKTAPPMRDIYARYAPRELQEGMVSRHREMPQIDFSDEDVDAILAYLHALAVGK
jgi:mono/diheme cytochrome c family protein